MRTMVVIAALALAGPASAADPAKPQSTEAKVVDTGKNIVEAPLKDLNLVKTKVPPLLESVMAVPYSLEGMRACGDYASAIHALDGVLGADVDSKKAAAAPEGASDFALGAVQSAAGSFIPGSGLIRKISGADKEAKHAAAAVYAGSVRRAFLKGTARAKGCKV